MRTFSPHYSWVVRGIKDRHGYISEDDARLIASSPALQAEVERLREVNAEMVKAARNVVDCWGVGRLNITALGQFIDELRSLLKRSTEV